jgi:uncharacterized protein
MSPRRTSAWPAGAPNWVDVTTPDIPAAQEFYAGLLGWTFGEGDPDYGGYCMALVDGITVAGMAPTQEGWTPAWTLYFSHDDVSAAAEQIPAAGGALVTEIMPIGDAGTMLVASDPSGAAFGLWQANEHIGVGLFNEPGGLSWEDLRSKDPDAAKAFYAALLGWTYEPLPEAGPDYGTFHHAGDPAPLGGLGGMMGMDSFPSHWVAYFGVPDVDEAVAYAEAHGGHVLSPGFDTPYGRMAALTDPFGAAFWITTPNADLTMPDREG